MALSSVDKSEAMLHVWDKWSSGGVEYKGLEDCRKTWDSFRRESGRVLTLGWLKRLAETDGYNPNRYTIKGTTAAELCKKNIVREYIIENLLVANEPGIIGGPSKTLNTSVGLDLAVSISTGKPFLNEFKVERPKRVLFISGESGEATIHEDLMSVALSKEIKTSELTNIFVEFNLPKLDDPKHVDTMVQDCIDLEIEVVTIDSLYRSLRAGGGASNVYAMGDKLGLVAEVVHRAGITPILMHHFHKSDDHFDRPPKLEDLSQAGIAEFCRQFILLKRRMAYHDDGKHCLWMRWGGSAGHQGSQILDAYTGTRELGLTWQTTLTGVKAWGDQQKSSKEFEKAEEHSEKMKSILDSFHSPEEILSPSVIKSRAHVGYPHSL